MRTVVFALVAAGAALFAQTASPPLQALEYAAASRGCTASSATSTPATRRPRSSGTDSPCTARAR